MKEKIFFLTSSADGVGVAKHCLTLIRDLREFYDITILVRQEGWLTEQIKKDNLDVTIISLQRELSLSNVLLSNLEVLRLIKNSDFNYIHLHGRYSLFISILYLFLRSFLKKTKVIYTVHQFYDLSDSGLFSMKKKLEIFILSFVDEIISVSKSLYDYSKKLFPNNNHSLINNYSIIAGTKNRHEKNIFNKGKVRIIMIGRLSPEKGFNSVFDTFKLCHQHYNFECDIYGNGPLEQFLKSEIVRFDLTSFVKLKGFKSNLDEVISEYDIIVIPSFSESFSLVAIESMLAGVTVLARNIPGLNDVVVDGVCGALFEDESEILEILNQLYADKDYHKSLNISAYNYAVEHYTFEAAKLKYFKVYSK